MTPLNFLWFRAVVGLIGIGVAAVAAARMVPGSADPGRAVPLLAVGIGLAIVAIPWRHDDRNQTPLRHTLHKPSSR